MTDFISTYVASALPSSEAEHSMLHHIAAVTIKKLALDPATCEVLGQKGAIPLLLNLLHSSSAGTAAHVQAVAAIGVLATSENNRKVIAASGGIPILVQLLSSPQCELQECAAAALWSLAFEANCRSAIAAAGGVPALLQVLSSSSTAVQEHAAGAVWNLAFEEILREDLISNGAILALVNLLASTAPAVQQHAAGALCNLAVDDQNVPLIVNAVGVRMLVQMLISGTGSVLELSVQLIQDMSRVLEFRQSIVAVGVIPALASVLSGRTPDSPVTECAAGTLAKLTVDHECARALAAEPGAASSLVQLLLTGSESESDVDYSSSSSSSSGDGSGGSRGSSSPQCSVLTLEYALITLSHICEYADSNQALITTPGAIQAVTSFLSSTNSSLQLAAAAVVSSIASVQANCQVLTAAGAIDQLMSMLAGGNSSSSSCRSCSCSSSSTDTSVTLIEHSPQPVSGSKASGPQQHHHATAVAVQQQQQQQQQNASAAVTDSSKLLTMQPQVPTLQTAGYSHRVAHTPSQEGNHKSNAAKQAAAVAAAATTTVTGSPTSNQYGASTCALSNTIAGDDPMSAFASFAQWHSGDWQSQTASGTAVDSTAGNSCSSGTSSDKSYCVSGTPGDTRSPRRHHQAHGVSVDISSSSLKGAKCKGYAARRESLEQQWLCPMKSVTSLMDGLQ